MKFGLFDPDLKAARIDDVVGVPLIFESAAWAFMTVANPASAMPSRAVFGAAHFLIAVTNVCHCEPVVSNALATYMPSAAPAAELIACGEVHGSMPMTLPE